MSATLAEPDTKRSEHVLAAAERAFARHGFHGANMQHVAAEAGMSAGNLYRYFKSKEAIVSGLTARDRDSLARDFHRLRQCLSGGLLEGLGQILRKHLVDEPVWRTQLVLEIWAESARNPSIGVMCGGINDSVTTDLLDLVAAAQSGSPAMSGGEPHFAVRVMMTVTAGLFKRRATEPEFESEAEISMALGVFRAVLDGSIQPYIAREAAPCA